MLELGVSHGRQATPRYIQLFPGVAVNPEVVSIATECSWLAIDVSRGQSPRQQVSDAQRSFVHFLRLHS